MEVRQREAVLHRYSQTDIVAMIAVSGASAVPVPEHMVGVEGIVIRSLRCCRNGKWYLHCRRLEDALRSQKAYPGITKDESPCEELSWQDLSMNGALCCQPIERSGPHSRVVASIKNGQWIHHPGPGTR